MALTQSSNEKKVYLNLFGGKWAKKVIEGTEGAQSRTNKKNEVVHEVLYDRVSGIIKEMKVTETDMGGGKKVKQLNILMSDIGEQYYLSIPTESKFFDTFVTKIGNADISRTIEIVPYSFEDGEKKVMGINIFQDGNKLPYYFSKEDPKGKPVPSGELSTDDWKIYKIQERKFLCDYISSLLKPSTASPNSLNTITNQDLPF